MSPADTVYLDHNATTPLLPEAREAMLEALGDAFGNPSSGHWAGRRARRIVAASRESVAALAGAEAAQIIFTSGATEALHQAVASVGAGRVVLSAVEHPATPGAIRATRGAAPPAGDVVRPRPHGPVALDDLLATVDRAPRPVLVALIAGQNVTGILNPVEDAAAALRERGIPLLVDASQVAGKLPLRVRPDYLVLAGHKLGGPKGVGALVLGGPDTPVRPLFFGGGQERGHRGGTEAVPAIAGFGAAARAALGELDARGQRMRRLRDDLEARLLVALPAARIIGAQAARLPNTSAIILPPGVEGETVVTQLHRAGVAASAGSACRTGSPEPAPVLLATGLTPDEAIRTLRLSLGVTSRPEDVTRLLEVLPGAVLRAAA